MGGGGRGSGRVGVGSSDVKYLFYINYIPHLVIFLLFDVFFPSALDVCDCKE